MRSLHLTLVIFCQLLLASFILYSNLALASPLHSTSEESKADKKPVIEPKSSAIQIDQKDSLHTLEAPKVEHKNAPVPVVEQQAQLVPKSAHSQQVMKEAKPAVILSTKTEDKHEEEVALMPKSSPFEEVKSMAVIEKAPDSAPSKDSKLLEKSTYYEMEKKSAVLEKVKVEFKPEDKPQIKSEPVQPVVAAAPVDSFLKVEKLVSEKVPAVPAINSIVESKIEPKSSVNVEVPSKVVVKDEQAAKKQPLASPEHVPFIGQVEKTFYEVDKKAPVVESKVESQGPQSVAASVSLTVQSPEPKVIVVSKSDVTPVLSSQPVQPPTRQSNGAPIVNGGLGPLHLLATTLCSYQPDRPVADETLNLLYNQRAAVRKSLFEFMSLKFTNLEKFSSRLNSGLEIMPPRVGDAFQASAGMGPSHGWPVVGKCTAHDLKLMAEAAWCETPAVGGGIRSGSGRALEEQVVDQSAVISKILHVSDPKLDAPSVEKTIANMNLTQQQLADIQVQATSTRLCRRNSLRLTKALFNHLAEDQKSQSESWPQLYTQLSEDDCARKRMIDIVNALSSFRSDSTTIRRDNVEFAFAMDDLRAKVLESEVNVPLTFDKQFIEVEQFLQQSVKLMLSNIDPARAKLTSMRYRSLMPGPLSADDQCIELHQRLLAKNYPTDCNPTQFGQLPDVLRMAASSLELWSIEKELSKQVARAPGLAHEYPTAPSNKRDLNECIANLVVS